MIRHESVVTALTGAVLGIAFGGAATGALSRCGRLFCVLAGSLVAFVIMAIVAGMPATIMPARRAARLDVLPALATQ